MPPASQKRENLKDYCDRVFKQVTTRGYRPLVSKNLRLIETWDGDGLSWESRYATEGDKRVWGKAHICNSADGKPDSICVPEEKHCLEALADTFDLNLQKLQAIGATDFLARSIFLVHETSHVRGQGKGTRKDYVRNEAITIALETARMEHHVQPEDQKALQLLEDLITLKLMCNDLFCRFLTKNQTSVYNWGASALSLTRARLRSDPTIWDGRNDRFREDFYQALQKNFGDASSSNVDRSFVLAQVSLREHCSIPQNKWAANNVSCMRALRYAALSAGTDLKQQAHKALRHDNSKTDAFQAALILRQFANLADSVMKYADDYYAVQSVVKAVNNPKAQTMETT